MNLKLRFALLFTLVVAFILLISSVTIYLLYANFRSEEYSRRALAEGQELYSLYNELATSEKGMSLRLLYEKHDKVLYSEHFIMTDTTGNIVIKIPDTLHPKINLQLLAKIKDNKIYNYREGVRENVGAYMEDSKLYLLISGVDRSGLSKLINLRIILAIVFVGGLLLAAIVSFFFVKQVFKPLSRLSMQMQYTTVHNMTERIAETDGNDEINEIARNFNAMLERLNKAFEFQKNFVYNASHELRTPLAAMLSQTELALNKEQGNTEHKRVLLLLKDDQQRLIELTNSLLLLSQYEQMRFMSDWPTSRIDELVYEAVATSQRMYPNLGANIMFAKPPEQDEDCMVLGNEVLLKSAFGNLIKNAYAYSLDKKVTIIMEMLKDAIYLHFDSTGAPLSAGEAEKIMVAFYRGDNALSTRGFGLGLSIVQRIVAVHNGSVTYSRPPSGEVNRFTIMLPKA